MAKDSFFVRVSSRETDYEMMRPFLSYGRNFIQWVVKNMKRLRRNATETELRVGKYLYHSRVIFVPQAPFVFDVDGKPKCYFADFYIPAIRTIVEIDGRRHSEPDCADYDRARDSMFDGIGIRTVRIMAHQVYSGEYKGLVPIPPAEFLRPEKVRVVPPDERMMRKDAELRKMLGCR